MYKPLLLIIGITCLQHFSGFTFTKKFLLQVLTPSKEDGVDDIEEEDYRGGQLRLTDCPTINQRSPGPATLSTLWSHRTQLQGQPLAGASPPSPHWSARLYQPFIELFYGNCVFTSSFIHQQNCVLTSIAVHFMTNHPHGLIKQKLAE